MLKPITRILLFCCFCFAGDFTLFAQPATTINQQELRHHLFFLASDNLQGRAPGATIAGLDKAASYLAKNLRSAGVDSIGGSYFQPFTLVSSQNDTVETGLKIRDKGGTLIYQTKSVVALPKSGNFKIQGAGIVLAGFGRSSKKKKINDFAGLNLKDKVVLIAAGSPAAFDQSKSFRFNYEEENLKAEHALKAGAAAVLIVNGLHDVHQAAFHRLERKNNQVKYSLRGNEQQIKPGNNCAFIPAWVADSLLRGNTSFKHYIAGMAKSRRANSFEVDHLHIDLVLQQKTEMQALKNVVGVVEGSDPKLNAECVVFMAHYDHLGMNENGLVYNGADDNGSGTATLLEVARVFQNMPEKPKRSLVFLWPAAEELGMFGSRHYVENPLFGLKKTVACINIDMNGRVFEARDSVWRHSPKLVKDFDGLFTLTNKVWPELKTINNKACSRLGLVPDYSLPSYFLRSSDHYWFHKNGIPVINYSTGYHADYHKVSDELSKINFAKMERVANLCVVIGIEIANHEFSGSK